MGGKSLQDLDGEDWGEPEWDSHLVTEVHRLRKVPISDLGVEDLRLLLGQELSLEHLVPRALELLEADPLAWDHHFLGELLLQVLDLPGDFWASHPTERARAGAVARRALELLEARAVPRRDEARTLYGAALEVRDALEDDERAVYDQATAFLRGKR